MLRKQMIEFLTNWPLKDADSEVRKIRKKYAKRNPAQLYKRAVTHANNAIDDLAFIMDKLPSRYREKVNLEKQAYVRVLNIIRTKDPDMKLKEALKQVDAGLGFIGDILVGGGPIKQLYSARYKEIRLILKILEELKTLEIERISERLNDEDTSTSTNSLYHHTQ